MGSAANLGAIAKTALGVLGERSHGTVDGPLVPCCTWHKLSTDVKCQLSMQCFHLQVADGTPGVQALQSHMIVRDFEIHVRSAPGPHVQHVRHKVASARASATSC